MMMRFVLLDEDDDFCDELMMFMRCNCVCLGFELYFMFIGVVV